MDINPVVYVFIVMVLGFAIVAFFIASIHLRFEGIELKLKIIIENRSEDYHIVTDGSAPVIPILADSVDYKSLEKIQKQLDDAEKQLFNSSNMSIRDRFKCINAVLFLSRKKQDLINNSILKNGVK